MDFVSFSKILDRYYPNTAKHKRSRPRIQGPDVCLGHETNSSPCANMTYFRTILQSIGPGVLDDVTAHAYGLRGPKPGSPPSFSQCHIEDFLNATTFQTTVVEATAKWLKVIETVSPNLRLVISETATAADGGCVGLSNRFIAGFYFIQILGKLGDMGVHQIYRQNLIGFGGIEFGSHYTLLNPPGWYSSNVSGGIRPNPDYFTAALYTLLVGPERLKVVSSNKLIHAACAVGGGIVVTFSNPTADSITFTLDTGLVDSKNVCKIRQNIDDKGDPVELYILTADSLTSSEIKLNGVPLGVQSTLDYVDGDSNHIEVPPYSYGFIVRR